VHIFENQGKSGTGNQQLAKPDPNLRPLSVISDLQWGGMG
jgi:hypothetical protein